jgi:hypothetical protein
MSPIGEAETKFRTEDRDENSDDISPLEAHARVRFRLAFLMTGVQKLERKGDKVTGTAENQCGDVSSLTGRNTLPNHGTLLQVRMKWEDLKSIHTHFHCILK